MEERTEKKIEDLTMQELKSLAYDELARLEVAQSNLRILNARIAELNKPKPDIE